MELRTSLSSLNIANICIYVLSALLGLFLNTLTIAILLKGKKFGKGIRIQLVNLAIADTLCSLVALVYAIVEGVVVLPSFSSYSTLKVCGLLQYIMNLLFQASLMSNTAISLERFVAVYFPLKMRDYQRCHVIAVTIAIWIFALVSSLPLVYKMGLYSNPSYNPDYLCMSKLFFIPSPTNIAVYSACYFLPVAVIVTSYTLISIKLKRREVIGERTDADNQRVNIQVSVFVSNSTFNNVFIK